MGTSLIDLELLNAPIALIGKNSYSWIISYLASSIIGTVVPIDKELHVDDMINFINISDAKAVICDEKYLKSILDNREKLKNDLNEQFTVSNNLNVEIEMIPAYPSVTKEDNAKLTYQIVDFTTNVADSTGNRKLNVKRALQDFNGMTIKPKESISFNNITCPHTTANGYKIAKVIVKE